MGRAIHTNWLARFKCDVLKLAMVKTERIARKLFGPQGRLYDSVCAFTPAGEGGVGLSSSSSSSSPAFNAPAAEAAGSSSAGPGPSSS